MATEIGLRRGQQGLDQTVVTVPGGQLIINRLAAGSRLAVHVHPEEQFGVAIAGSFKLIAGDPPAAIVVDTHRGYRLATGVPHGARGGDAPALSIDIKRRAVAEFGGRDVTRCLGQRAAGLTREYRLPWVTCLVSTGRRLTAATTPSGHGRFAFLVDYDERTRSLGPVWRLDVDPAPLPAGGQARVLIELDSWI